LPCQSLEHRPVDLSEFDSDFHVQSESERQRGCKKPSFYKDGIKLMKGYNLGTKITVLLWVIWGWFDPGPLTYIC
jgi:hypothetical protein